MNTIRIIFYDNGAEAYRLGCKTEQDVARVVEKHGNGLQYRTEPMQGIADNDPRFTRFGD
jgi:hypothetical protein